jgi:hypothetical protein
VVPVWAGAGFGRKLDLPRVCVVAGFGRKLRLPRVSVVEGFGRKLRLPRVVVEEDFDRKLRLPHVAVEEGYRRKLCHAEGVCFAARFEPVRTGVNLVFSAAGFALVLLHVAVAEDLQLETQTRTGTSCMLEEFRFFEALGLTVCVASEYLQEQGRRHHRWSSLLVAVAVAAVVVVVTH